ncbi:PH domain-containing protein [Williamsia sp. SKLECPSW1]
MSDETSGADWELVHRSVRTPRIAVAVAAVVVAIHVVVGVLLRVSDTGVDFRVSDQVGLALIGVVLGGAILTFTRPRIRAGAQGVEIRNLVGEKVFGWDMVEGIWYPDKGRWARLELPDYENVPVMAIQAADGALAVAAMERFRELHARYHADAPS